MDFIDSASSGMAPFAWAQAVGSEGDTWAFGLATVRGEADSMSYRNAVVVDDGKGPIGALISHPLPTEPQPIAAVPPGLTTTLWQELRNHACGAWHIGVLAGYPAHGARQLSLLVADANAGARQLYERLGFRERGAGQ